MYKFSKTNWTFDLTAAFDSRHFAVVKNEKKFGGFQARFRDIGPQRWAFLLYNTTKIFKMCLTLVKLIGLSN